MPNRFSALKTDDNPFKKEPVRKKRSVKSQEPSTTSDIFKSRPKQQKRPKAQTQCGDSMIFASKVNEIKVCDKEFKLEDVAFPELSTKGVSDVVKKPSIKLNFGGTLNREKETWSKTSSKGTVRSGVNIYSSERSKLSLKITNLIIKKMEDHECKMHYMAWHNNWQRDREYRMSQGETFYEPYNLEDLDDDDNSESDDYEMEETEYWGANRGNRTYDN